MSRKLNDYLVSIIHNGEKESMMLKAYTEKEAKEKVYDVVMKSSLWNYAKDEFDLECNKIRILEGGNYEIIVHYRNRNNGKQIK